MGDIGDKGSKGGPGLIGDAGKQVKGTVVCIYPSYPRIVHLY